VKFAACGLVPQYSPLYLLDSGLPVYNVCADSTPAPGATTSGLKRPSEGVGPREEKGARLVGLGEGLDRQGMVQQRAAGL